MLLCIVANLAVSQSTYSRVKFDLSKVDINDLTRMGLETDHGFLIPGVHFVNDFSQEEIAKINASSIDHNIMIPDLAKHYKNRPKSSATRTTGSCDGGDGQALYDYNTPENYTYGSMGGYHTFEEMLIVLDSMRSKYPHLISAKTPVGNIKTWESNDIWWLRLSDNPDVDEEGEPEALYTALHHAREPNGLSQMLFYLWYMLENYDTDPEVKYLVDNTEMYFIPCINPDGYLFNQETNPNGGGFWRKNRRPAEGGGGVGVDLNRNYDFFWGNDDNGSSPDSESSTYRGPEGFSEPETKAVRDFTIDHEIMIALNYHTFGNLLIHPWGYNDQPTDEDSIFKAIGKSMIKENNFTLGTGTETVGYTVNGDSDDYLYGEEGEKNKIYAMTPEVGDGFWPDSTQIEGFNKLCMYQNLATAHSLLNHYDARMNVPNLVEEDEGVFVLDITKSGFKEGTVTVEIVSLSPYLIFDQFLMNYDLKIAQNRMEDITFTISGNAPPLVDLSFDVKVDNGEVVLTDTYNFTYRRSINEEIISNDLSDPSTLSDIGDWALTEDRFVSAPTSLTDSPDGNYEAGMINIVSISDAIDLTNIEFAALKFSAQWAIEANYDYVLVQASTDGENWTSLCGNYTSNGSANSHGTTDPLLDGTQSEWVVEEMNLSDYVGQTIQLRMLMRSDAFVELDGIYIDDILVESNVLVISDVNELDPSSINVYPSINDGQFVIEMKETNKSNATVEILTSNGQLINVYKNLDKKNTITIDNLSSGVYLVKYSDGEKSVTKRISVIK
ncbi:MAG: murein tripeptide amidase MpaA [Halioglobus sp.]|jgi:murein tripeptide amidase MpaA